MKRNEGKRLQKFTGREKRAGGGQILYHKLFRTRIRRDRRDEYVDLDSQIFQKESLTGNVQRVEYLRSLGWEVEEEPIETLQFLFPEKLEEPYLSYNELQLPQGFDLRECLGRQVSRYTYAVLNHPSRAEGVQANLYLCEGVPAAGDLFCPGSGGFQDPLIPGGTEEGR